MSARWMLGAGVVLLGAVAISVPAASARPVAGVPCSFFSPQVKSIFHITVPPSTGTSSLPGGVTAESCSFGGKVVVFVDTPATLKTYNAVRPKSGKPLSGVGTQAVTENGTSTSAVVDAKTGKTSMVTKMTFTELCFEHDASHDVVHPNVGLAIAFFVGSDGNEVAVG